VFFAEDISHAKAQRRKALPRFRRSSLRLCAYAREIILATDAPWVFVQSLAEVKRAALGARTKRRQAAALQGDAQIP
jgi:chorismate-pyruvate lyase